MSGGDSFYEPASAAGLVFRKQQEALWFQSESTPTDAQEILDTWPRTDGMTFFFNPADATGESADWTYDATTETFVQPNNAATNLSILSPVKIDSYTFEATLTSPNNDDDFIGLIAAMELDGSNNPIMLGVWISANKTSPFEICYIDSTTTGTGEVIKNSSAIQTYNNQDATAVGWDGKSVRVQISRVGGVVSAKCSDWDATGTLLDASELTVNFNDLPRDGAMLNTSARYGFVTRSQAGSTYIGYSIQSSQIEDNTKIYAEETNERWVYSSGTWTKTGTAYQDFSNLDRVNNRLTKEVFDVNTSTLQFRRNDGIPYGTVTLTVNSAGETFPESTFTSEYTFSETLSVVGIYGESTGISVTLGSGDITIDPQSETSGYFYFKLQSPEQVDPNTGIVSKNIAYRKCEFTV